MFETIAHVEDPAIARVLIAALKAHGFHPLEQSDGLPGLPGVIGPKGIPISVRQDEAEDAQVLAEALIKEMQA